ncbi:MAG TPA: hypothetical protein VLX29_04335 [Nitrospirota bacterium]|nr:hypothetical protein [Nitrospirota bacterium]
MQIRYAWPSKGAVCVRMIIGGMLIFFLHGCSDNDARTLGDACSSGGCVPGSSPRSYYISDSTGSDGYTAAEAQNPLTPWKSLNNISGVVKGDFVCLKKGDTWTNQTLATTDDGETFSAYGTGAKPVVIGPGSGGWAFSSISHSDVVVDGIEFCNADTTVMIVGADSPTIKNCKIVGTGSTNAEGIRINSNGYNITNVLIGGAGQGNEIISSGIGIILVPGNPDTIYDAEISYNNIHDCGLEGIKTYGSTSSYTGPYGINVSHNTFNNIGTRAIWVQGGWQNVAGHPNYIGYNTATNIGTLSSPNVNAFQLNYIDTAIIEYNTIANVYTSAPDGDGIELDLAWGDHSKMSNNLTVRYNIVSGCNSGGESQSAGISAVGCTNSAIYYNIVHHNHIGISHSTQYTTTNSFYNNVMDSNNYGALRGDYYGHVGAPASVWKNNIISNSVIYGFILDQWSSGPSESYNLWFNNPANIYKDGAGPIPIDSTDIVNDPLFLGPTDYHLADNSPAIFAGTNVGLTSDFDGNPVPKNMGGTPSIGAYEP